MSADTSSPRTSSEGQHREGRGDEPANSTPTRDADDVVPISSLSPAGEEDVVPISAIAPTGEEGAVPISSLAPDGERDVIPIRALEPDDDSGPAGSRLPEAVSDATMPGWEEWEGALAAIGGPQGGGGGSAPLSASQSSPQPFPTDEFGFLDLPENYRLAAARGVADPAEWPTDEEWRRAAATPASGSAAVPRDEHDAASRAVEARLHAARVLTDIADRIREGLLPLRIPAESAGEAAVLVAVLESVINRGAEGRGEGLDDGAEG
jgi:hypothetical protein